MLIGSIKQRKQNSLVGLSVADMSPEAGWLATVVAAIGAWLAAKKIPITIQLKKHATIPPPPTQDPRIDELITLVRKLSDRVNALSDRVESVSDRLAAVGERVARIEGRLDR